ncbi:MAG: hypothetical protein J5965_05930 [Aeriscardovia sp.]|nr:hypothetical protein [Aeriscardovia sp.]
MTVQNNSVYTPTDPPMQNILTVQQLMSLFDDTLYDKSPYSHLTRLITLLNGPIGAGRFLNHTIQTMLNMNINTAYHSFVLSLAKSVYGLTLPYESTIEENNQWHTLEQWETLFIRNQNYRHTFSMLMKGFNQGNTMRGVQTVAEAMLNTNNIQLIPYYEPTPLIPSSWWINKSAQQVLLLYPLDTDPSLLAACCECCHLLLSPNVILIPHVNTLTTTTATSSNTCGYASQSHLTGTRSLIIQQSLRMSQPPQGCNTINQQENTMISEATMPDTLRWDPIIISITHNNSRSNIQTTTNSSNTIIPPTMFKSTPPLVNTHSTQPALTTENIHANY